MNKFQRNTNIFIILGILIFSIEIALLHAQEIKPVKSDSTAGATGSAAKKEDRPKPIKEVLPDAQKIDGLITLYRKKEKLYAEIKSSNLNTDYLIAMAIAKGSGWNAIGGYTLQDSDEDWLWQFRKVNDSIQIVRRNIRFKADSGTPEAKSVDVAYSDSILYSLPILAIGENGGDVIDMASVFMSDLPKLGRDVGGSFARDRSTWGEVKGFPNNIEFRVAATYSVYRYYSNSADSPDASSVGVTIHYSVSKLPSTGYSSRLADNRIGYFTTTHKNFSRNEKDDHFVRYINRWNIQKADSSATLSPPKKPIVFWIEKTVPFKYRHAVREGILEWNKAFEKIGIVNAIEVRQQSDSDNWDAEDINYNTIRWITSDAGFAMGPSHVNPLTGEIIDADIIVDAGFIDYWKDRFDHFIADLIPPESDKKNDIASLFQNRRKKHGETQNTVSHSGSNGCHCTEARNKATQIALASLAVSLINEEDAPDEASEEETEKEEDKNENTDEKSDEKSDEKTDEKSEESKESEKTGDEKKDDKESDKTADKKSDEKTDEKSDADKKDEKKEDEKKENGDANKNKDDKKDDDKKEGKKDTKKPSRQEKEKAMAEKLEQIILAGVKDLVMHEVGHTLGLRHNFKASSWLTLEEINKPDRSKEFGIAGSVMDYLPINVAPKGQPQGDYFMSTLGPYDYLAIEYGYKIISGGTDGELKELQKIAARQAEKGKNFATDEDILVTDSDPLVSTRDLGSNPLDYAKTATARYEQLLPELLDRSVKEGGSYKDAGRFFLLLAFDRASANYVLARNVGGLYVNRDHRGDPDSRPPIQVVDAKTQRDSLEYICKTIFAADSFKIPHEVYNRFGEEKWLHWNYAIYGSRTWNLSDLILYIRRYILFQLLDPLTLERLEETQLRVGEGDDVYTIDELFETLTDTIFKELATIKEGEFTVRKPAIGLTQRMLQNYYFEILSYYSLGEMYPLSSQSIARQQLTSLSSNIQALLTGKAKLDTASRTHLLSLQERIRKVLDANLIRFNP
ncbi:MAG: zinc-dependent metalloprotease [Planctomycetaceae bacterium]|jgi:outer membrane biosynthesis protein TonB|nr:zinc-dependent metalloprotease [Planctomycetaceae bacterium]